MTTSSSLLSYTFLKTDLVIQANSKTGIDLEVLLTLAQIPVPGETWYCFIYLHTQEKKRQYLLSHATPEIPVRDIMKTRSKPAVR